MFDESLTTHIITRPTTPPLTYSRCQITGYPPIAHLMPHLHDSEKERLALMKSPLRQATYATSRYAAKQALTALIPIEHLTDIHIDNGIFGHPISRHPHIHNTTLSISHKQDRTIAIAFPESHPMGIDIEPIQPDKTRVITSRFTPHEHQLQDHTTLDAATFATLIWTAKESLSKIIKTGLMIHTDLLEIATITIDSPTTLTMTYTHFFQYKSHATLDPGWVTTLCLPKNSTIQSLLK